MLRLPLEGKLSTKETDEVEMAAYTIIPDTSSGAAAPPSPRGEGVWRAFFWLSSSLLL